MVDNDYDCDRSRRPDVEDRRWSDTGRILGGRTIRRSDDAVCDLHYACGKDEHGYG
jgi:hypothetical protein